MSMYTRELLRQTRHKKGTQQDVNEEDELLVFGYASRLYENDERAEWIAEDQHLIAHPTDAQLLTDRYDCRLYLGSLSEFDCVQEGSEISSSTRPDEQPCPAESLEEEMCQEERYKDLYDDIRRVEEEENERRRRAEIGFNYDEGTATKEESSSSEEEIDEPFVAPEGIKLPVGMNLPETMKQNAVIERTATFVVAQGVQMEIVIKAKQRGNLDQFAFLEFDHPLNAYYKYISKMIREKKYIPKPHIPQRRPKPKKLLRLQEEEKKRNLAAAAEAEEDATSNASDSDSDGEHYLHPLLLGGAAAAREASRSSSPIIGPKTKEEQENTPTPPTPQVKVDYELGKGNDMYSSLFNSLSVIVHSQSTPVLSKQSAVGTEGEDGMAEDDYVKWYVNFYGERPPVLKQPALVPPPPDMSAAVNKAAEYVAKCGCQGEYMLAERTDLAWDFLKSSSPYYSYYQSRVRFYQCNNAEAAQKTADLEGETSTSAAIKLESGNDETTTDGPNTSGKLSGIPAGGDRSSVANTELSSALKNSIDGVEEGEKEMKEEFMAEAGAGSAAVDRGNEPASPPVYMNRKMRRRGFHDPPRGRQSAQQNEQVESVKEDAQMPKVQSSPALLVQASGAAKAVTETKKAVAPISFSLTLPKTDEQRPPRTSAAILGAYDDDEENSESAAKGLDVPAGVVTNIPPPGLAIPPPPVAPVPLASGQLALEGSAELQMERKQRARLFMEKILNEKRTAKLRAQNEEQQKKGEEMVKKVAEEQTRKESTLLSTISKKGSTSKRASEKIANPAGLPLSPCDIDKLINSEIEKLVVEIPSKSDAEKSAPERANESKASTKKKKKKKKKKKERESEEDADPPLRQRVIGSRRRRGDIGLQAKMIGPEGALIVWAAFIFVGINRRKWGVGYK
ncbi:unnamed protein product [Toxocara canis]|uniref:Protein suppressor of white apricot n=1 Tax=Toxocara canis TaxID=6265 RepID=A0A183UJL3_TOXCA|nr:unnamed protein product [Toxocara canis]